MDRNYLWKNYPGCPYPVVPSAGDVIGIDGLAVTAFVTSRVLWPDRIILVAEIDLARCDWSLPELSTHLLDAGHALL